MASEQPDTTLIPIADDQVDLMTFVEKGRRALDDMVDAFEPDETRTEEEWTEEFGTTLHNS